MSELDDADAKCARCCLQARGNAREQVQRELSLMLEHQEHGGTGVQQDHKVQLQVNDLKFVKKIN